MHAWSAAAGSGEGKTATNGEMTRRPIPDTRNFNVYRPTTLLYTLICLHLCHSFTLAVCLIGNIVGHLVASMKLIKINVGPGWYLDGWPSADG